jgi:hypothetical protein
MIVVEVIATDGVSGKLERFGRDAPKHLDKILRMVGSQYRAELKKKYLSGQMLGRVSGNLVRSLYVGPAKGKRHVYVVGQKATKSVQDFGGVSIVRREAVGIKLANIYEHAGGYTIVPKNKKCLMFVTKEGNIVFTKKVTGHARPFMTASAKAFNWPTAFEKTTDRIITEEARKLGLEATP